MRAGRLLRQQQGGRPLRGPLCLTRSAAPKFPLRSPQRATATSSSTAVAAASRGAEAASIRSATRRLPNRQRHPAAHRTGRAASRRTTACGPSPCALWSAPSTRWRCGLRLPGAVPAALSPPNICSAPRRSPKRAAPPIGSCVWRTRFLRLLPLVTPIDVIARMQIGLAPGLSGG